MEYLHLNATALTAVPHGNLWSPNVLLDEDNVAKVSDYGLISLMVPSLAAQLMAAYKTPEYDHKRKVSKISNVWSYGCFLLELLTGRLFPPRVTNRPIAWSEGGTVAPLGPSRGSGGVDRREARPGDSDPERGGEGDVRSAQACALVLRDAAKTLPEKRPQMGEVVRAVEKIKNSREENDSTDKSSLMEESRSE